MFRAFKNLVPVNLAGMLVGGLVVFGVADASAQPYLGDITRWTTQDGLDPPADNPILFVGSSSIRRWEQLALDLADYEIVQRGFGGALFDDVNFWVNEIVLSYEPEAIVIWAGTNDNTSGQPGSEIFEDYQQFVGAVHAAQPGVEILYLGITPTPTNTPFETERELANSLIAGMAATDARLFYIDLPAYFDTLNPPSGPDFVSMYVDGVHLNRSGYDAWSAIVRPALEAVIAPNKVFTPNPLTPQPGSSVLFDFGPDNPEDGAHTASPDANGNHWNNWHPAEGAIAVNAGEHIAGLVDTAGKPTGLRLTVTGGFSSNGLVNGGLLAPDPLLLGDLAVATATQDYFFSGADGVPGGGNDDVPGGFMIDGLDPGLVYEFRFFGSRTTTASRSTEYFVTGATAGVATLRTSGSNIGTDGAYDGNDDEIAEVGGIRPDAFGQVFVDLTVAEGEFAYLNAMELRVVNLSIGAQPSDMVVDAGGTLTFTAGVVNASPGIALRWERDGTPLVDGGRISGAASETLTITGAGRADVGEYRLVATLGGASAASAPAIGAVRGTPLGALDIDGNGSINAMDALAFIVEMMAVLP